MAHYVCARYDTDDHLFLPPLRTLGFNPQLTMNDSLLVQSYIEAYDISYPEALRRIENEVAELKQHLESKGQYELNDIGILSLKEDGRLVFEPCEAGILTPSLYGLSSFEMQPVAEVEQKQPVTPVITVVTPESDSTTKKVEEPLITVLDVEADETKKKENDPDTIVIKMSWVRNAVAVVAAAIVFFLIQTPVSNSNVINDVPQQSAVLHIN